MKKILLANRDYTLTITLRKLLEKEGFFVHIACNTMQILQQLNNSIDLLLLEMVFTEKNNINFLKNLRKKYQTPIIILTSNDNELDRVAILEMGADDYLSKPFNHRELIARVRAILRRTYWIKQQYLNKHIDIPLLKIDFLCLDFSRQEATFDGILLHLTGTEFSLLYLLAQNLGYVVSREFLSKEVLGKQLTPFDRAIDMHISNLRKKLPIRKDGYPWFKTLRGKGYLMVSTI